MSKRYSWYPVGRRVWYYPDKEDVTDRKTAVIHGHLHDSQFDLVIHLMEDSGITEMACRFEDVKIYYRDLTLGR